jgi:hypothetical protein
MQVESPSFRSIARSLDNKSGCRVKVTETPEPANPNVDSDSDDCSHPAHAPFFGDDCAAAACGYT